MNMVRNTLAALAILTMSVPAHANIQLPPVEFDVGTDAMTVDEIVAAYHQRSITPAKLWAVKLEQAIYICDVVNRERTGKPFPAGDFWNTNKYTLLGCNVLNAYGRVTDIVYSYDTPELAKSEGRKYLPGLANLTLRHEIGHAVGWSPYHFDGRGPESINLREEE